MLSRSVVTIRHTLLAAGAVLVMGMAIYLVREVSREPADARASRPAQEEPAPPPPTEPTRPVEPPPTTSRVVRANPRPPMPEVSSDTPAPATPGEVQPALSVDSLPSKLANPKMDAVMNEANRAYDQGEFDEAKSIALKVLAKQPGNVRMLRIVVSSECIAGDSAEAQKYFAQLPAADRAQMRTRCDRYGVTLKDP